MAPRHNNLIPFGESISDGSASRNTDPASDTKSSPVAVDQPKARCQDHTEFGLRLTTREVCDLAKFSSVTLWRRIRAGRMPQPIDRGREAIFDRAAVVAALTAKPLVTTAPADWVADVVSSRRAQLAKRQKKSI